MRRDSLFNHPGSCPADRGHPISQPVRATDMSETEALEKVIRLKTSFERFVSTILADGLPASPGASSWRSAEKRQRNGEVMAWAITNSLSLTIAHLGSPEKMVRVEWPDKKLSFYQLI